jgi:IS30 family transposase
MKNKHLTFDDRLEIESGLKDGLSFKKIGNKINKDATTISKEVRNHYQVKNSGATGKPFFDCKFGYNCEYRGIGEKCPFDKCNHYQKEICLKLSKPPYVCNGCKKKSRCTLSKNIYEAEFAQKEYKDTLIESRQGINYTEPEIAALNEILVPLIKEQKQSIHHAYINNINSIMCSEKQIYNLIDMGVLEVRNIDLPRKVRYRKIPKRNTYYKIDKKCLDGRKYENFKDFINDNPDINIVEMDSVEGIKGGKVLLTLHFVNCSFMLAFIRDHNDAQSVIDIFNNLEERLGLDTFKRLFPVILTDNGSEFSNPSKIEVSPDSEEKRTKIYYCEPGRSDQKGACEVNHEMIRRVLPQGTSFDDLTQQDINLLMSHINSYKRKKLNDCSPLQLFNLMYGDDIANKFDIIEVKPNNINLSDNLLQ